MSFIKLLGASLKGLSLHSHMVSWSNDVKKNTSEVIENNVPSHYAAEHCELRTMWSVYTWWMSVWFKSASQHFMIYKITSISSGWDLGMFLNNNLHKWCQKLAVDVVKIYICFVASCLHQTKKQLYNFLYPPSAVLVVQSNKYYLSGQPSREIC